VKGAIEFFSKEQFTQDIQSEKGAALIELLKGIAGKKIRGAEKVQAPAPKLESRDIRAVVIGSSTGGPKALMEFCALLPAKFPVPIALVQHNSSGFDKGFVQWLDDYTPLKVCLAEAGELPKKGCLYVAPTDVHLLWMPGGFTLDTKKPPVVNQKPAVDMLFQSAAKTFGQELVSVVLTGMGNDGGEGTRAVKTGGGITIAQDEETSMIYGMPRAAFETGCVDYVLPLTGIPPKLIEIVGA
jgi:two-component system chemotaxis response regulator CheB